MGRGNGIWRGEMMGLRGERGKEVFGYLDFRIWWRYLRHFHCIRDFSLILSAEKDDLTALEDISTLLRI